MAIGDFFKNVVTLGAYGTLQEVQAEYAEYKDTYDVTYLSFVDKQDKFKTLVRSIVKTRKKTLQTVKKAKNVLKNLSIKDREKLNVDFDNKNGYSYYQIEEMVSMDDVSFENIGSNILENTSASMDIVGKSGLLDDLDSKDAQKAMAAAALAAAAVTAIVNVVNLNVETRKQISSFREQNTKLAQSIAVLKKETLMYELAIARLLEIFQSLEKGLEAFQFIYTDVSKSVNPLGILSVFLRNFTSKNKRRHSDEQLEKINKMISSISNILKMVDALPPIKVVMADAEQIAAQGENDGE